METSISKTQTQIKRLSSRNLDRIELFLTFCLSMLPVAYAFVYIFVHKVPFWLYWEPDFSYMMDGLNLLLNGRVHMLVHPGIPCQYLSAALLSPWYFYIKIKGGDFPEFCVANISFLAVYFRLSFSLILSFGIFINAIVIKRFVPQLGMAVLAAIIFLIPDITMASVMRVNTEPVLIFLFGIWLFLYSKFIFENDSAKKKKYLYGILLLSGFMVATKIVAFPIMFVVFFLVFRNIKYLIFPITGFILGILPFAFNVHELARVVRRIKKEVLEKEFILFQENSMSFLASHVKGFWAFCCENWESVAVFFIISGTLILLSRKMKKDKSILATSAVFLISSLMGFLVMWRYPTPRYLLISIFLLLVSALIRLRMLPANILRNIILLFILLFTPLAISKINNSLNQVITRERTAATFADLTKNILRDPQNTSIASWWIDPMLAPWTLLMANSDAAGVITEPLRRRFPHYVIHGVAERKFINFDGKIKPFERIEWNYLIFQDDVYGAYRQFFNELVHGIKYSVVVHDATTGLTVIKMERQHGKY